MNSLVLLDDEVVLYSGEATSPKYDGAIKVTLTSKKVVLECAQDAEKKIFEIADTVDLSMVKWYHDAAQVKQHGSSVEIQSMSGIYNLTFSGILEARKFVNKAIEAVTDTTLAVRVSEKTKKAIDLVDETLDVDTRGAIKGALSKGLKDVIWNGFGKKK